LSQIFRNPSTVLFKATVSSMLTI